MPKNRRDQEAEAFGKRLAALLAEAGQPRRGAGVYLAKRYRVSTVTANDWLNGNFKPNTETARQIAVDHGSTFDDLYFGRHSERLQEPPPIPYVASHAAREQRLTMRAAARLMRLAREYVIGEIDEDALIDNAIDTAMEIGPGRILAGEGLDEGVRRMAAKMKTASTGAR